MIAEQSTESDDYVNVRTDNEALAKANGQLTMSLLGFKFFNPLEK